MQRSGVLKLVLVLGLGLSAGVSLRATGAEAAPLTPAPLVAPHDLHRAVTSSEETAKLAPQQVHWGHHWHHRHWGWHHRRHWGWHHRHWGWRHHHHWGWRHHHWHRHHWHHHRHW